MNILTQQVKSLKRIDIIIIDKELHGNLCIYFDYDHVPIVVIFSTPDAPAPPDNGPKPAANDSDDSDREDDSDSDASFSD